MKWQCWKCSSDDGCELIDLVGGDPVHEPVGCPWGGIAKWERAAENSGAQPSQATNSESKAITLLNEIDSIYQSTVDREIGFERIGEVLNGWA